MLAVPVDKLREIMPDSWESCRMFPRHNRQLPNCQGGRGSHRSPGRAAGQATGDMGSRVAKRKLTKAEKPKFRVFAEIRDT